MARRIRLTSTAYGPPWGGIQGTGVTSTGIDLRKHPHQYVVAVDPSVIPYGTQLKIPDNPFGDPNIVFTAADTGGAIKGKRLDFFDWRGRKTQMRWGTRPIEAEIVGAGGKPQRAAQGGAGGAGGPGAIYAAGTSPSGFSGAQGPDLAALIGSMMKPAGGGGGGMGLASPAFAARAPLPAGYQPLPSGGGPAPRPDVGSIIRDLLPSLQGGDIPKAPSQGVLIPGAGGVGAAPLSSARGNYAYPLGRRGKVIGTPYQGTHTLGNWQSDRAVDISIPVGTPVYATEDGEVTRAGPLGKGGGRFAGQRVQLEGRRDNFWYGHLSKLTVKLGQHVKRGQLIGYSGSANGVPHLHFAQERGDPTRYFG